MEGVLLIHWYLPDTLFCHIFQSNLLLNSLSFSGATKELKHSNMHAAGYLGWIWDFADSQLLSTLTDGVKGGTADEN